MAAEKNGTPYCPKSSWKPWQTSSWYLVPLITISSAVAAVLEFLAQTSNKSADSTLLLTEWLVWYTGSSEYSQQTLQVSFAQTPQACKQGILTFTKVTDVSTGAYILWIYFPSIFFVLFAIFWEIVDNEAKRIEPFYQASHHGGAKAGTSIFAEYLDVPSFLSPLQALYWRHWTIVLCSLNMVLLGTVTPILQSQLFQTQTQLVQVGYISDSTGFTPLAKGQTNVPNNAGEITGICWNDPDQLSLYLFENSQDDDPETLTTGLLQNVVYVDPVMCRVQEAVLFAVALSGSIFLYFCRSRQSGMKDPLRGFVLTASLCSIDPKLLESFRNATAHENAEEQLKSMVISLRWKIANEQPEYGFWLVGDEAGHINRPPNRFQRCVRAIKMKARSTKFLSTFFGPLNGMIWSFRLSLVGFCFLWLFCAVYGGLDKDDGSARTWDPISQGGSILQSAPDLIVSAFAKSVWKVAERKTASYWIFHNAHLREQRAWPVMGRDYASLPPGVVTVRALLDHQWVLALITFFSLLLEIAHICFGITVSMAQGQGATINGILTNQWVASGVLIFITVFTPFWWRFLFGGRGYQFGFPVLERDPGNFGMQMTYACQNRQLLGDIRSLAAMDEPDRMARLKNWHYSYSSGNIIFSA